MWYPDYNLCLSPNTQIHSAFLTTDYYYAVRKLSYESIQVTSDFEFVTVSNQKTVISSKKEIFMKPPALV